MLRCLFPFRRTIPYIPKNRILPDNPTIGDRIRCKRLELQLTQKDIGQILKVSEVSITNWENNLAEPHIESFPAIIKFLQCNPFAVVLGTLGGRIKNYRIIHGLNHKELGIILGVDRSTIGSWENDEHYPQQKVLVGLLKLLNNQ